MFEFVCVIGGGFGAMNAQALSADQKAYVDNLGVLRWEGSNDEVALLGVNYYTPFTVDYQRIKDLGGDHRQAILDDVTHLKRLGLGCIRVHCFDREFSDAKGNFIDNHHVEMLDFLISTCASNDIYTVLTPIAWWGGSYAPGNINGFSNDFTMQEMTTNPEAWKIQARFLKQFAEHVNRFTKRRYADDPAVLSFECINEPLYPKDTPDSLVTSYINTLADALRASGTHKPIYYNSWHGRNAAAGAAHIDGVTASVYPTGLASGHALSGSQLLKARGSSLNPDDSIATKSRMIYEFDAADVPGSYMYPSMAKFFRSQSIQVASQFQYDPVMLADVNRNWQTHHLNLIYTPGKALSLAIAAEVFRRVPRGITFGELPGAAIFPPFRCSDAEDLSEMAAEDAFIYSNTTRTQPPAPDRLERVWGCGSSPCVTYGGSGAYFLDRVVSGVWRLQVYPDIFNITDAYTGTDQLKVCVRSGSHRMRVDLPDIDMNFSVHRNFKDGSVDMAVHSEDGVFDVSPGDYLIVRQGISLNPVLLRSAAQAAPRYTAPPPVKESTPLICADIPNQYRAGICLPLHMDALFATNAVVELISPDGRILTLSMKRSEKSKTRFETEVPSAMFSPGTWYLRFLACGPEGHSSYPDIHAKDIVWIPVGNSSLRLFPHEDAENPKQGVEPVNHGAETISIENGAARDTGRQALHLHVEGVEVGGSAAGFTQSFKPVSFPSVQEEMGLRVEPAIPLTAVGASIPWSLFDVNAWLRTPIWSKPIKRWRVSDDRGRAAVHIGADGFDDDFQSLSLRGTCDGATFARLWPRDDAGETLYVYARSAMPDTTAFELALIEEDGVAWGTNVKLTPEWRTILIPVKSLRLFSHWDPQIAERAGEHLRLSRLKQVNLCFGRWLFPAVADRQHAVEISEIGILP